MMGDNLLPVQLPCYNTVRDLQLDAARNLQRAEERNAQSRGRAAQGQQW